MTGEGDRVSSEKGVGVGKLRALVHEDPDFRHSQNRGIALSPHTVVLLTRRTVWTALAILVPPGSMSSAMLHPAQGEGILVRCLRELPSLNRYSSAGV
jgi:hypothetical protein